jgi:outer membrane protein TolC
LQLRSQLAAEFRTYESARARALRYARNILPNSRTTVELAEAGLAAGELTFLDVLTARTELYQTNLEYIDALENLWVASQRIEGLLLSNSLTPVD